MPTTHAAQPPTDLEKINDSSRRKECSTRWMYLRIQAGQLTRYRIPGDLCTYVSAAEVDALMAPRAIG